MRFRFKKFLLIVFVFMVVLSGGFLIRKTLLKKDLININELSQEFMDNYFEEVSEVSDEDKENMLIVTSKNKIKDTYGAVKIIEAPNNQYFLQYGSEEEKKLALEKLNSEDSDMEVSENLVRTFDEDTVLVSNYNSWGVEAMGIDTLLDQLENKQLNDVVVAVIDTGLDVDLFNEKYPGRLAGVYNVLEKNNDAYDESGHGTHVAGTIAEATTNNVKILAVKASGGKYIYANDIIAAIDYATYNKKADVINMSFSGEGYSRGEHNSIEAAKQQNIISVASAGNKNEFDDRYPSAFDNTLSISAVDVDMNKADFSNYGNSIMFAAPGVGIKSIARDESKQIKNGTSMASPHVSGAVANLKSMNKNLTFDDTITLLRRYSDDIGDAGWDQYFGYGFINFTGAELCDNHDCDEYNVFKVSDHDNLEDIVDSYELEPILTEYNYGTITNILGTKIKIRYTNNTLVEYPLYDIKNFEIRGYEPYSSGEQTVNIKLKTPLGIEINDSFKVTNPAIYESAWEYRIVGNNNIELTDYNDSQFTGALLYVPSTIDGYTVTGIADRSDSMFIENSDSFKNIKSIYLPSSLTKIGNNAFSNSFDDERLTNVISDAESITVGDYAFYGCNSLSELDANISYIGDYAFSMATSLFTVKLSDDIAHIGKRAFNGSLLSSKFVVPSTITEIGDEAFYGSRLEEIVFLNNMEKISENMMYDSNSLKSVTLPEGINEIGDNAFASCEKLQTINLPQSLLTIGTGAFNNSFDPDSYVSVVVPTNVTSIGEEAFSSANINELTFLNNISILPTRLFSDSVQLEKIILPDELSAVKVTDFSTNSMLKEVHFGRNIATIEEGTFKDMDVKLYVYSNSVPKTYANENNINYVQVDPDVISVQGINSQYHAFDKIDMSNVSVNLTYNEKSVRTETITQNIEIVYPDSRVDLRVGDTSVKLITYNKAGYKVEKDVAIEVSKLEPNFEIPSGLQAYVGQKLSDVQLPDNFEWMDVNQSISESGDKVFKAKFVPDDTANYSIVLDIDITLTVDELGVPEITKYQVEDDIIIGIPLNTNVSDLDLGLSDSYTIKVKNKANEDKEGFIGTGDRIEIYFSNNLVSNYYVSINGDINGDGEISVSDVSMIYKNLKRKSEFSNAQTMASDVNGDGGISVSDISMIYKHIKKKINI